MNKKNIKDIKDKYNLEEIKDAFDDGCILPQLEFFFVGDNDDFLNACNLIGLDENNNEFVLFLYFHMGQNILTKNSLSIHIETRNIFYSSFNTNENVYNFSLAQQDETKLFLPKRISYHYSFERYMKQFSPALSLEESNKYDFLTNKNSKYLLYKFNDWIESLNAEKIKLRHSSVDRDGVGLTEIQKTKKKQNKTKKKRQPAFDRKKLSVKLEKLIHAR